MELFSGTCILTGFIFEMHQLPLNSLCIRKWKEIQIGKALSIINCSYYHTAGRKDKITEHISNIVEPQKSRSQLVLSKNQYFSGVNHSHQLKHSDKFALEMQIAAKVLIQNSDQCMFSFLDHIKLRDRTTKFNGP